MTIALPPSLTLPEEQRKRALWQCALYDAERGDTTDLQTMICEEPIPEEYRAAVADLIAKLPKSKRGTRRILTSSEIIEIHDYKNTVGLGQLQKTIARELAPKYSVKASLIEDVLACRNTFKHMDALRYVRATLKKSIGEITLQSSAKVSTASRRKRR